MKKRDLGDKILRSIKRRRYDRFVKRIFGRKQAEVAPELTDEKIERKSERFLAHIAKTRVKKPPAPARTQGARKSMTSLPLP